MSKFLGFEGARLYSDCDFDDEVVFVVLDKTKNMNNNEKHILRKFLFVVFTCAICRFVCHMTYAIQYNIFTIATGNH